MYTNARADLAYSLIYTFRKEGESYIYGLITIDYYTRELSREEAKSSFTNISVQLEKFYTVQLQRLFLLCFPIRTLKTERSLAPGPRVFIILVSALLSTRISGRWVVR